MQQSLIGGPDFHDHSSSVKAIAHTSAHAGVGDLNMQLPPLSSIFSDCTTRAARSGEGPATDHRLPRRQACSRPSLSSKNSPLLLKKKQKKMQKDEDDSDNEEEEEGEDMEEEEEKERTSKIVSGDGCFSVVCCKHCSRKFASGRALGGHMRTHNHPKQLSPSSCNGLASSSSSDYYDDDREAEEGRKKKKHPLSFDDHFGKPMHRESNREVQGNQKTKLDYVNSDDAMAEIDGEVEESQKSKLLGYAGDFDNVSMCEINGGIEKGKKKKLGGAYGKFSNSTMEIYGEVEEGRKKLEYRKFDDCAQEIDGEIEDGQIKLGYGCLVNSARGVDGKVKEGRKKLDYGNFRNAVRIIEGSEIEGGCKKKLGYGSIGNSPWRTDREAKEGKKKNLGYGHPRRSSAQEIGRKLAEGGKYSRKASYGKFRSLTQNNIDNYTLPQPPPCVKASESPFVGVKQEEEEEGGSLSVAHKGINGREPISAKEGGGGGGREEEEEEEEEESDEGKASGHGLYMLRQNPKRSRRFDDRESDDCAGALAFLPPRVEKSAEISAENMNNSSLAASSSSSSSICREAGPAMACTVCSREFLSWRALCGHMRCHPDREWRGIHPPLIPNQRKLVRRCRKINPANSGKLADRNGHSSTSTEVVMEEFHHGHVKEGGGGEGGRGFGKLVSDSESDSRYESPSKGACHDWHQLHRFGHGVTGKRSKRTWHSVKYLTNVEKEEGPLKALHSSLPEQLGIEEEAEEEEEEEDEEEDNGEDDEDDDNNEEDEEEEEIAMAIAMGNGLVILACAARRSEEKESSPALISRSNTVAKDERLESAREMERERVRRLDSQRQIYGGCDEESYYNGDENSSVAARREELTERNQNSQNIGRPGISMSKYDCGTCKRSFNSHQALGGHRASHRHVKGCFAKTTEDEDEDEDAEDEEQQEEEVAAADREEREEGVEEREEEEEEEGKVVRVKTIIQPLTPKDKEKEKLEKGNSNTSSNPNPYPNLNLNSNATLKSSHSHNPSSNPNPNPNPNASTSYARGSGGQLTAKVYSKIHECSICHRVFASGQALGGHKRCHWNGDTKLLSAPKSATKAAVGLSTLLDLNLPAPLEDSNPMHGAYVVSNQHNRLDVATKDEPCSSTSNIPQLAFSLFHHPSQGSLIKSRVV